jgi:septum site-determining protein MinC
MSNTVTVKGIREGILFHISDQDWNENFQALTTLVKDRQEFWKGAKVVLDAGNSEVTSDQLLALKDELSGYDLALWAVLSENKSTQNAAQFLGLATRISRLESNLTTDFETTYYQGEEAIIFNKTLRSGFRIEYDGHIIVIGDVNPGAEIVASGSVLVWGKLRGLVHAGALGNETAVVCALDLQPTQLRIAEQISITPKRRGKPQPEMAYLCDGKVVAEAWNYKG